MLTDLNLTRVFVAIYEAGSLTAYDEAGDGLSIFSTETPLPSSP